MADGETYPESGSSGVGRFWSRLWRGTDVCFVSRLYGQALVDNFAMFQPVDPVAFQTLKDELAGEMRKKEPALEQLFRIENAIMQQTPDADVIARFWSIEDRFQRVVPGPSRAKHAESVPPRTAEIWQDAAFVRRQAMTMLDVIHSDLQLNIWRELCIKRLKLTAWLVLAVCIILVSLLANLQKVEADWLKWTNAMPIAFPILFLAGVVGAVLSLSDRLQQAVVRDAMIADGVFEIMGLRVGWVSTVISSLSGGVFALVLYVIVMAGLLDLAKPNVAGAPTGTTAPQAGTGVAAQSPPAMTDAADTTVLALPEAPAVEPAAGDATPSAGSDSGAADKGETIRDDQFTRCKAGTNCAVGQYYAESLGLQEGQDFFRILLLAFLAGFAERLVPDILGRLAKKTAGG